MVPRCLTVNLLLIVLALLGIIFVPGSVRAREDTRTCQSLHVSAALGPGQPDQYSIYGELCHPSSGASTTVQLLIPGGTYSHVYWDFPYEPQTYSYVRALNAAGYSTFNIDRIGTGRSSHPLSVLLTMGANAYVVHQIVQDLRNGLIGGEPFARVLLVSHSVGSVTAWVEAGTYHDVDGVIITGLTHHLNTLKLTAATTTLYPAGLDPRFADARLDVGYLTTQPGTRGDDFYYKSGADPKVLTTDEATKETVTSGELDTFAIAIANGISGQITVPVLVVMGQQDSLFCGLLATNCSSATTVQQAEAPYYSAQARLQVVTISNSGHNLNLHKSVSAWFKAAKLWALQHVAP